MLPYPAGSKPHHPLSWQWARVTSFLSGRLFKNALFLPPQDVNSLYRSWMGTGDFRITGLIRGLWDKECPQGWPNLISKENSQSASLAPHPSKFYCLLPRHHVEPPALRRCPWLFLNSYVSYLYRIRNYSYLDTCRMIDFILILYPVSPTRLQVPWPGNGLSFFELL